MRLRRLELTRYGMFEDFLLDFQQPDQGESDIHIIFGPNESGKTTAFHAFLDFLFGFPRSSRFAFRHGPKMQVSATLETDDRLLRLTRLKRMKDNLLNEDSFPIDPEMLDTALSGLRREAWTTMFSLDEDSLQKGAEDILSAKGDLGRLLFQGASGLLELNSTLETLQGKAETIYKPRARKTQLKGLEARFKAISGELKAIDTDASTYKKLSKVLKDAREAEGEADRRRREIAFARKQVERRISAIPMLQELRQKRHQIARLADFPEVPDEWQQKVELLRSDFQRHEARKREAEERIASISESLRQIPEGTELREFRTEAESLRQSAAESLASMRDLPKRIEQRTRIEEGIKGSLFAIGAPVDADPGDYVLPEPAIAELARLTSRYAEIELKMRAAKEELDDILEAVRSASRETSSEPKVNADAEELEAIVTGMRLEELMADRKEAEILVTNAKGQLEQALRGVRPWHGDPSDIRKQVPPTRNLSTQWRDTQRRLDETDIKLADQLNEVKVELRRLDSEINQMTTSEGLVSDEQARKSRVERDNAWACHEAELSRETAELFKQALDRDDAIVAARIQQTDRISDLRHKLRERSGREGARSGLQRAIIDTSQKKDALKAEAGEHLLALGLPASFSLLDLPDWLERRDRAEKAFSVMCRATLKLESFDKVIEQQRLALIDEMKGRGLAGFDDSVPIDQVRHLAVKAAQTARQGRMERESREKERVRTRENLERRRRVLDQLQRERDAWDLQWRRACNRPWLSGRSPTEIGALLDELRQVRTNYVRLEDLSDRITKMEALVNRSKAQITRLAATMGMTPDRDPIAYYEILTGKIEEAEKHYRSQQQSERSLGYEKRKRRDADAELVQCMQRIKEMGLRFSPQRRVRDIAQLADAVSYAIQKKELLKTVALLETQIVSLFKARSIDAIESELDAVDPAELDSRLLTCTTEEKRAGEDHRSMIEARIIAEKELESVGGDAAAAVLDQKRRTVQLEVGELVKTYCRLRFGVLAAHRAMVKYREIHRNEMLESASRFFAAMTGGHYSKLETEIGGTSESLLARRESDKMACSIDALSRGTGIQLFLALRLAGYQGFCKSSNPLPLVADDIMQSFDDERSRATFRLLKDISRLGQIIYFTHHEHVVELAEEACEGSIHRHTLPSVH